MVDISPEDRPKVERALRKLLPHIPVEYRDEATPFLMDSFNAIAATMGAERLDELVKDLEQLKLDIEQQNTEHVIELGEKYNVPSAYLAIFASMMLGDSANSNGNTADPLAIDTAEFSGEIDG